ncbi:MAG: hypothetical protein ABI675_19585 [Chitinophagaceae bacterium]
MPYRNGKLQKHETVWTDEMVEFLNKNFHILTNQELADSLNLRRTVTRNKLRDLGLKRMELEYWSEEMIDFLKKSYKKIGDVEIMEFFIRMYPKAKGWKRGAIWKKRKQMGLQRTKQQKEKIETCHRKKGGRCYTIDRNSSSKNLAPMWVAQRIAWRNPELQRELIKYPDIIEAARKLILLKRKIKHNEK